MASLLLSAGTVHAQNDRPIRLLVGFSAGGGTDVLARLLAEKLKDELQRPVIVENRPGAGGMVAAAALKNAAADGTTLFLTNDHTTSIIPLVQKNPGYDVQEDFTPVAGVADYVSVLFIGAAVPAKSFAEYTRWVSERQAGKSSIAIPAPASLPEFITKAIGARAKLDLVPVPYKGAAPMLGDIMGNQIPAGISAVNDTLEPQKAGKIQVLAVAGDARQSIYPGVPTFSEVGIPGFEQSPFYAIYAPRGTPQAFIDTFSKATQKVLAQPAMAERMNALGLKVRYLPPQATAERERAYAQAWAPLVKALGYYPQ